MTRLFTLFLVVLFIIPQVKAQGSWNPEGADLSFPRTLLDRNNIPAVRAAIQSGVRKELYTSIYDEITGNVPTLSDRNQERRLHATFAKNTAFVLLMNQRPTGNNLSNLTPPERNNLLNQAKNLLEKINTTVSPFNVAEWQWRSKELIDYMVAYDLLRGTGESAESLTTGRSKLQEFAGNLHQASINIPFYQLFPNHNALMTAAALGLSAVVLNDATSSNPNRQPINWINTGMYNLDNILWRDNNNRQSDPTEIAGYAEGPYYFKDAFLNVLPFTRAMGNFLPADYKANYGNSRQLILNPYFDPSYDLLYGWITNIAMPDGRFPALEDSYISMGMPELALTGKSQYVLPLKLDNLHADQINTLTRQLGQYGYTNVDMRAAYLAANLEPTAPQHKTLTVLPQSGNLVFRSGSDPLATYLHVYGKNGSAQTNNGSSSHADATSFILQAKGQLLALDPGFINVAQRDKVAGGANHNLILINGAASDAEAFIQNTFTTQNLAYGEVKSTYNNAIVTRKTLFVRNTHFIMADFINSGSSKRYTWQLHGYGLENGSDNSKNDPGIFTDKLATHEGIWQKNGVKLQAHVTATGGATEYTKQNSVHELGYDRTENHTAMRVNKNNATNTQFLSLLYPYTTTPATVTTTSTPNTASLAATEAGFKDIAFTQNTNTPTTYTNLLLPEPVISNGLFTFFSLSNDNNFAQLLLNQGTTLTYGSTEIVKATDMVDVSWAQLDEQTYEGYVNRATTLTLSLPFRPSLVLGDNIVRPFTYDEETEKLELTFTGPSNFTIVIEPVALPVELLNFKASRQNHLVKLNWQTASETQNAGFAVLRKAEGETAFSQIGFVSGHGNSTQLKNYSFVDKTAPATVTYYRLKQTDFNGASELSPIVAVPGLKVASPTLIVAPVPANQYLRVNLIGSDQEINLRLTNLDGKLIMEKKFKHQITLDVSSVSAGMYYLQAIDSTGRSITAGQKVIINH